MRAVLVVGIAAAVAALVAACPPSSPPPVPPSPNPPPDQPPPPPPDDDGAPGDDGSAAGADGAACDTGADCASGVCEGEGCGAGQGRCAPRQRACTKDLRPYCGCDGVTFRSSGTCPGKRYQHRGACKDDGDDDDDGKAGGRADGSPCFAASDCASGICEGKGCTNDAPGTCVPRDRMCTMDLGTYCGCDDETFTGSGSCPGRRYQKRGKCE